MAPKIFLSPSNQADNVYAAGNTTEAVQCGRIAEFCQCALERCGFETKLMHYQKMAQKVAAADAWGADLYVPIHTNAHNGNVDGTRLFCYSFADVGYQACKAVFDVLAPLTPGDSENIKEATYYEIITPNAPTVYIEVDFHDVPSVANWLISNAEAIGEAIAKGICNYYDLDYVSKEPVPEEVPAVDEPYVVRINGATPVFRDRPVVLQTLTKGAFTIIEVVGDYGRLKSGAGWIPLAGTVRV